MSALFIGKSSGSSLTAWLTVSVSWIVGIVTVQLATINFFFSLQLTRLIYLGLWIAPKTSMSGCTLVMIIRDFWTPHPVSYLNMSEDLLKTCICVCISTLMLECMNKVVGVAFLSSTLITK